MHPTQAVEVMRTGSDLAGQALGGRIGWLRSAGKSEPKCTGLSTSHKCPATKSLAARTIRSRSVHL